MTEMKKKPNTVYDSKGTAYTFSLADEIGSGGQGKVFKTNHPNILVKINKKQEVTDLFEERRQIHQVMRSSARGLNIALPLDLLKLKNRVGYVMELMDGLEPLQAQIERLQPDGTSLDLAFYRDTGGFGRRLRILRSLAEILAKLHARGLAYGDLSPHNIFVSSSVEHHQVWLIDSDNIRIHEHCKTNTFFTKGYAAPEIIRGESGSNIWTDCWSFAVIALQLLAHAHPFNQGCAVEDENPDIGETNAERGEYPWILDSTDDSNAWTGSGFPVDQLMSSRIMQLFQRCFGDSRQVDGLSNRPTMAEWHHVLHRASQMILRCSASDCRNTFIYNASQQCPFCSEVCDPQTYVRFSHWLHIGDDLWDAQQSNESVESRWTECSENMILNLNDEMYLYHEPYSEFDMDMQQPWCKLALSMEGLHISPEAGVTVQLSNVSGSTTAQMTKHKVLNVQQKKRQRLCISAPPKNHSATMSSFFWQFIW
jgi:DNA-binding helix-hairpin-helix protein with protein kinase domain